MIFFNDCPAAFYPISLTRDPGDLRCGILKLRQRWQAAMENEDTEVWVEDHLIGLYKERHPDWLINVPAGAPSLHINSRLVYDSNSLHMVKELQNGHALVANSVVVALFGVLRETAVPTPESLHELGFVLKECPLKVYNHLADIIHDNERLLREDFTSIFFEQDNFFETEPGVTVLDPYNVWLGEEVILKPGVVLDASDGPIVIDNGVLVMPNSVLIGPCYIGKNSIIKTAAKIYPGTSIGPVCKVGGEVEGSIFHAYSNKQHDGFLGHSYIGEWVNIGADTNNSDLKNTYKNVALYSYLHDRKIDSGSMFMGTVIGDHSKLGINCTINTGCVIGCACNLWGSDLISDHVLDLSWGTANAMEPYKLNAFKQTAAIVKSRRELFFTPIEEDIYKYIKQYQENKCKNT